MEISFIVVLWIIVTIIEAVSDGKRRAKLPPQDSQFEMPQVNSQNQAEVEDFNFVEFYRQKKQAERKVAPPEIKPAEKKVDADLEITPESAMNAIILSEILDKPKALRRRR